MKILIATILIAVSSFSFADEKLRDRNVETIKVEGNEIYFKTNRGQILVSSIDCNAQVIGQDAVISHRGNFISNYSHLRVHRADGVSVACRMGKLFDAETLAKR